MAKKVTIVAVIEDDWDMQDFEHEANDALVKHAVVIFVESVEVTDENYNYKADLGLEDNEDKESNDEQGCQE